MFAASHRPLPGLASLPNPPPRQRLPISCGTISSSSSCNGYCNVATVSWSGSVRKWAGCPCACAAVAVADESTVLEEDEGQFVEVGVVISKHGVRGELLVRSSTDFPEERFEKPGLRWMKVSHRGKQRIQCVELLKGRSRAGKLPCWLITLKDITSPEQAAAFVGATMLVKRDDRPTLAEGDFYISDLIGMDVVLQSSGETIGTIADMYNFGAQDLLHVLRIPTSSVGDGPMIWIPFVEAIVPEVRLMERKVIVNPPEGLLELNIPAKGIPKSETRKQEIRAKRKLQERVSGLKKSLVKSKQAHVLAGFSVGEKDEREMFVDELLKIDFKALQTSFHDALDRAKKHMCRQSGFVQLPQRPLADWKELEVWMESSCTISNEVEDSNTSIGKWWKQGLQLIADCKVAVVSFASVPDNLKMGVKSVFQIQAERLLVIQELAALEFPEGICQIPWFIMTSNDSVDAIRSFFQDRDLFRLKETQVYILAQDINPCFDANAVDGNHQILMKAPRKIAQSSTGDGGFFKVLSAEGLIDEFADKGIEYLQVYDADNKKARIADPVFFGFAHKQRSDLSIKVVPRQSGKDTIGFMKTADIAANDEEAGVRDTNTNGGHDLVRTYNIHEASSVTTNVADQTCYAAATPLGSYILSTTFLKKLQDSGFEFELHTRLSRVPFYKEEDGQVNPEEPNALRLEYSLLDSLVKCEPDKVSLLEVKWEDEFAESGTTVSEAQSSCESEEAVGIEAGTERTEQQKRILLLKSYAGL